MPWREVSIMSSREEFVLLASEEGANVRELCRRFGISAPSAYKWLGRYRADREAGLQDRPRTPKQSPKRTEETVTAAILALRDAHPAWGARKLLARLGALGHPALPTPSTVQAILKRERRIDPASSAQHHPWHRFEHPTPNDLWQMDFKGHFAVAAARCHPLTVLDDHSRFNLCLQACANQQSNTVRAALTGVFRSYGLPLRMTMDNGAPWGDDGHSPYTQFTVWLMRLEIQVGHSRPYHPQTQGKDERFHRTLQAEVLSGQTFSDWRGLQQRFDRWREVYNLERPHQALGMVPPIARYAMSPRPFPETLAPIDYAPHDAVRKVQANGEFSFHHQTFKLSKAFRGYPIGLRPTREDAIWEVFFCQHKVAQINQKTGETTKPVTLAKPSFQPGGVNHVSEHL